VFKAGTKDDAMTDTAQTSLQPRAGAGAGGPQHSGRIVVGIDGSQGSLTALRWALGEARARARARKIPVHAVFAWQYRPGGGDSNLGSMFPLAYRPDAPAVADIATSMKELLDAAVSKTTESDPDSATDPVPITLETIEGHPAHVLLDSVGGCDLLVVGSRGHGGFVGTLLGSVSHQVLSHSRCPVVVVPTPQRSAKD
jgi:nucleotide-binding universal stress UspA family protein